MTSHTADQSASSGGHVQQTVKINVRGSCAHCTVVSWASVQRHLQPPTCSLLWRNVQKLRRPADCLIKQVDGKCRQLVWQTEADHRMQSRWLEGSMRDTRGYCVHRRDRCSWHRLHSSIHWLTPAYNSRTEKLPDPGQLQKYSSLHCARQVLCVVHIPCYYIAVTAHAPRQHLDTFSLTRKTLPHTQRGWYRFQ